MEVDGRILNADFWRAFQGVYTGDEKKLRCGVVRAGAWCGYHGYGDGGCRTSSAQPKNPAEKGNLPVQL